MAKHPRENLIDVLLHGRSCNKVGQFSPQPSERLAETIAPNPGQEVRLLSPLSPGATSQWRVVCGACGAEDRAC